MSPALPSAAIPAPPGWLASEVLELVEPRLGAHVIVSAEAVRTGVTASELSQAYGRTLEALPDYVDLGVDERAGAAPAVRRLAWTPRGGATVAQIQAYAVEGNRAYVATATTQRERFTALEPQLRTLLDAILEPVLSGTAIAGVADTTAPDDRIDRVESDAPRQSSRESERERAAAWATAAEAFGEPSAGAVRLSVVTNAKGVAE